MSFIGLVTDTSAGLSVEAAARHNVRLVPLYIHMRGETLRDLYDVSPETLYEQLPKCDPLPTTSQPSVGDLDALYTDLIAHGASAIISVHLSSGISGTINSAQLAAQNHEDTPVEIIDMQSACASQLLTVETGIKALAEGRGLAETVAAMRETATRQKTIFMVDTLEYLYKGGRIGGAAALLGSVLQFKPLLYFKEGRLDALERVRTSARALPRMGEILREWLGGDEDMQVIIMHAAAPERANALGEQIRQFVRIAAMRVMPVPAVLGAHVGNGTVAVCCCPVSVCGMPVEGVLPSL